MSARSKLRFSLKNINSLAPLNGCTDYLSQVDIAGYTQVVELNLKTIEAGFYLWIACFLLTICYFFVAFAVNFVYDWKDDRFIG